MDQKDETTQFRQARAKPIEAPLGTMMIVLVYGAATVIMWFYMYYIMLKSEGFLGGF